MSSWTGASIAAKVFPAFKPVPIPVVRGTSTWASCVSWCSIRRLGDGCSVVSSSSESSSARKPPRARGLGGFGFGFDASSGRGRLVLVWVRVWVWAWAGEELAGKVMGDDGASIVARNQKRRMALETARWWSLVVVWSSVVVVGMVQC